MNQRQPPRQTYKAMLWDYDDLLSRSDEECCYSLSEREIQILLAGLEYIGWKTRYQPTDTEINQTTINHWKANLARKLMTGCCGEDDLHRYGDDGVYETSTDGGITWEDDPANDPRNTYVGAPHLPGAPSDALKCAAADNVRDLFTSYRDSLIGYLEAGTPLIAIIAGILAFIAAITGVSGAGIGISVLLMGVAAGLLTMTPEGVADQIDSEVLNEFRCLVYCLMEDNGQITYDNWLILLNQIAETFDGFPETFFYQTVNGMGYIGVSNAATIGISSAEDCGDCDCGESCAYKYEIWQEETYGNAYGSIVGYADDYVDVACGPTGYITIKATDINDCCFLGSVEVISGSGVVSGHLDCGTEFSGGFIPTTPVGQCNSYIEAQFTVNGVMRFHFGEC